MKAVAYYRVSTAAQGRSGLGLDAQKAAVADLARQRDLTLLAEFTEVESGKRNDRPTLAQAMHHARITNAVLVIAKLDRLSRNAAFLLTLRDSGVRFLAADVPDANDLTIGVLAVIAQGRARGYIPPHEGGFGDHQDQTRCRRRSHLQPHGPNHSPPGQSAGCSRSGQIRWIDRPCD